MTTEELLSELQARHAEGIVVLTFPESSERLYHWWGDRTLCIGLTSRIAYMMNRELEEWEDEETEVGVMMVAEVGPPPESPCGQYL